MVNGKSEAVFPQATGVHYWLETKPVLRALRFSRDSTSCLNSGRRVESTEIIFLFQLWKSGASVDDKIE